MKVCRNQEVGWRVLGEFSALGLKSSELNILNSVRSCAKNVAKWGTLILEAHSPVTGITAFGAMSLGN